MAIEIVSEPAVADWSAGVTCPDCETHFTFTGEDLATASFKISGYHWDGTAVCADRAFITCPYCSRMTTYAQDTVPGWLWARLPNDDSD